MRRTGLGFRLALGASVLVTLAAAAVAWGVVDRVVGDLHRALELRGGAVARDLAEDAAKPLMDKDFRTVENLLARVWGEQDLARVEVRDIDGAMIATRVFPAEPMKGAVVMAPVTTEPDVDGFRDTVGVVRITLSGAGNAGRRVRYLQQAGWLAGGVIIVGLLLAVGLSWALVRPLRRLQVAASALGDGEYDGELPLGGPREVNELGLVVRDAIAAVAAREADLTDANEKLRRAEEAREAMTHMLVHDLKGPLSNLLMLLDVLGADADEEDRALVDQGRARCSGLLERVHDLLAMGRLEGGHPTLELETVTASVLVAEAVSAVDHLAKRRRMTIEQEASDVRLVCDRRLIRRVLENLLVNAVRHGASPIRVEVARDGPNAFLVVEDGGAGVPAELADSIFEKFQKGAGSKGGAGLGLAFVRLVARAHGGDAMVRGARFEVRLAAVPSA